MKIINDICRIAGIVISSVALIPAVPALAQIAVADRPALLAKGYNQSDFRAAEQTQIGSNYRPYLKFSACLEQARNVIIMNNVIDARANLILSQCRNDGLLLRAAIAQSIGLAQASRVVSMINDASLLQLEKSMQAQNGASSSGLTRIGIWLIEQLDQQTCIASVKDSNYADDVRFMNYHGHIMILLKTSFPQPSTGDFTNDRVTIGHYPAPSVMENQFRVIRLDNQTWMAANVSANDRNYILRGGVINIEQHDSSKREERVVGRNIADVIKFVGQCSK